MSERPALVLLDDDLALVVEDCGAKAASLAALSRWPPEVRPAVPDGVVLCVGVRSVDDVDAEQFRGAVAALGPAAAGYAVRSSAVDEDGSAVSMAGRYLSVLDVPTDGLGAAVQRVLDSGSVDGAPNMAVLIQPMVRADRYGVVLVEPVDHAAGTRHRVVIELAPEPDGVTSGTAAPARWDLQVNDGAAESAQLPDDLVGLSTWAVAAARHLASGIDVEVAITGHEFTVVQLRPLTASIGGVAPPQGDPAATPGPGLCGVAVGDGTVVGTVVRVDSGDELAALSEVPDDAVLVTGATDPSFVPYLGAFVGVITEQGGIASHAAIVCRELGILAVVGVDGARGSLDSGDRVRIAGESGRGVVERDLDLTPG